MRGPGRWCWCGRGCIAPLSPPSQARWCSPSGGRPRSSRRARSGWSWRGRICVRIRSGRLRCWIGAPVRFPRAPRFPMGARCWPPSTAALRRRPRSCGWPSPAIRGFVPRPRANRCLLRCCPDVEEKTRAWRVFFPPPLPERAGFEDAFVLELLDRLVVDARAEVLPAVVGGDEDDVALVQLARHAHADGRDRARGDAHEEALL